MARDKIGNDRKDKLLYQTKDFSNEQSRGRNTNIYLKFKSKHRICGMKRRKN